MIIPTMAPIRRVLDEAGGFLAIATGAVGTTGGAGATGICSTGVPQFSQNFTPGLTSFPQDVQNAMDQRLGERWDIFYEKIRGVKEDRSEINWQITRIPTCRGTVPE
jgi:hypothetical protein